MSSEKNTTKSSILISGGDINIGDKTEIINFLGKKESIVMFILAMERKRYLEIKDIAISSLGIHREEIFCNKKLYMHENDDIIDDLSDFFASSFGEYEVLEKYYNESSYMWKPFVHENPRAENRTIKMIVDYIFEHKNIEILWLDTSIDNLLSNHDKRTVFKIFEKAILIVDPISLSHPDYKDFFEEVYQNAEIGGVISITSESLPDKLRRLSKLLVKRLAYRWDRKCNILESKSIFISIANEVNLKNYLILACEHLLQIRIHTSQFDKSHGEIPNSNFLGRKN